MTSATGRPPGQEAGGSSGDLCAQSAVQMSIPPCAATENRRLFGSDGISVGRSMAQRDVDLCCDEGRAQRASRPGASSATTRRSNQPPHIPPPPPRHRRPPYTASSVKSDARRRDTMAAWLDSGGRRSNTRGSGQAFDDANAARRGDHGRDAQKPSGRPLAVPAVSYDN